MWVTAVVVHCLPPSAPLIATIFGGF